MKIQTAEAYLRTKAAEKFIKDIERLIEKGVNVKAFTEKYENKMNRNFYGNNWRYY